MNDPTSPRLYPPRMSRSQPQLATAYAPGAMFTWEGGKGACGSAPVEGAAIDFSARPTRRDQIIENLEEFCQSWLARGMAITRDAPVYEVQLLDSCFYNPMRTGAAVVPMVLARDQAAGLKLMVEPELEIIRSGNPKADIRTNTVRITQWLERTVRSYPDQWNWMNIRRYISTKYNIKKQRQF